MPAIVGDWALLGDRTSVVEDILRPLAEAPAGAVRNRNVLRCTRATTASRSRFIIGVHDGVTPTVDYRDWRFSSYRRGFRCMYFEIWEPHTDQADLFLLNRAYFGLYQALPRALGEKEILAIHADPIIRDADDHALYKQGPHMHVSVAGNPFKEAHIALNRCHLEDVLRSAEALTDAIRQSVVLVREQVLPLSWPDAA